MQKFGTGALNWVPHKRWFTIAGTTRTQMTAVWKCVFAFVLLAIVATIFGQRAGFEGTNAASGYVLLLTYAAVLLGMAMAGWGGPEQDGLDESTRTWHRQIAVRKFGVSEVTSSVVWTIGGLLVGPFLGMLPQLSLFSPGIGALAVIFSLHRQSGNIVAALARSIVLAVGAFPIAAGIWGVFLMFSYLPNIDWA